MAADMMKRFYALQEERVQTYQLLNEGHEAYLKGAPHYNFDMYKQLIHEITQAFNKISTDILSTEKGLQELGETSVANYIMQIQECEKSKLHLTVKLQLATKNIIDHPNQSEYKEEVDNLKQELNLKVEEINEKLDDLKYEAEHLLT